jgi:hypothetical protein
MSFRCFDWRRAVVGPLRIALAIAVVRPATLVAQRRVPVLTAKEELRIDANDQDLSSVGFILPARDGSMAVAQPSDHLIRFFSATGQPAGTFGREGEGPGEFRNMGAAGTVGDTLWVLDMGNARTVYVGPDHKLLRSTRLAQSLKATPTDSAGLAGIMGGIPVNGVYRDGTFLTRLYLPKNAPKPSWYPDGAAGSPVVIASPAGVFRRLIAIEPPSPPECQKNGTMNGGTWGAVVPFCFAGQEDIATDGSRIAFARGTNATEAQASYQVIVIAATADTLVARNYSYHPIPISQHVSDSVRDLLTSRPGMAPQLVDAFRKMSFPPTFPPLHSVLVGRDGTIWVEEWAADANHHWRILDPEGSPIGALTLPHNIRVSIAERNRFWGISTDADGLQSVVRYRIGKP